MDMFMMDISIFDEVNMLGSHKENLRRKVVGKVKNVINVVGYASYLLIRFKLSVITFFISELVVEKVIAKIEDSGPYKSIT